MRWLIRFGGCAALHICEAAVFGPYQPQSAAAFASLFTARRSNEEGLVLFILWGLLRDATSMERPGLFMLCGVVAWSVVALASWLFRTPIPVLVVVHIVALASARLLYILLVTASGYQITTSCILPYILRAAPAALLVFLLLDRPKEEVPV